MAVNVEVARSLSQLHIEVVEATNLLVAPANDSLRQYCEVVAQNAKAAMESNEWAQQCQQTRQLLRFGKFKPTGRSKPAQEYLQRCIANDGGLPRINGPVDLLNAVSVEFNLPISLLSVLKCSSDLCIDRGKPGESFVFNSAGQILDIADLITVYDRSCDPPRPVGSPVKDSMAGKIEPMDHHLVAIIYAPNSVAAKERSAKAQRRLADGFKSYCLARASW